jgi:AraC-like DNA-binding protein
LTLARTDTRNTARFWRDPTVPGLSCLAADFTTHDYAPHRHEALVVAVTEIGGSEFKSRGLTEEAKPSRLLVFNPDEPHSGRMARSGRWRYRGLYLTGAAIAAVKSAVGIEVTPYFTRNVFDDADLIESFLSLHHSLDCGTVFEQRSHLVASFGELFLRYGSGAVRMEAAPRDGAKIAALKTIARERYTENLSLDDMGASVGLTPFQLIALFKRETGLTPHAFLTQLRLKAAIAAMKKGVPIAEAAIAAGFYDQSALTKHFKRCFGITPLQWVRADHH